MQETKNFRLKKQELSDPADITQISDNWDIIDAELANKLDKEAIEGDFSVQGSLNLKADVVKGTKPEVTTSASINVFDKNGQSTATNRLARVDYSVSPDGAATMGLIVNKYEAGSGETQTGLYVRQQANGTPRVFLSQNPQKDSNSQDVATTGWVRQLAATTAEYGLVKLADESDALVSPDPLAVVNVPLLYELGDYRRIGTAYEVGDRVACAFQFEYYLECTQAGITSEESLDTRNVTFNQEIDDGSVKWVVRKRLFQINGAFPDADGNIEISGGGSGEGGEEGGGGESGGEVTPPSGETLVTKPKLIAPINNATDVTTLPTLQASEYFCLITTEPRAYREFSLTASGGSVALSEQVNADEWTITEQLDPKTAYQWKCRDVTEHGLIGPWSELGTFTTGEGAGVDTPTLTVTGAPASVPENPTLTGSEFSVHGAEDTHQCTDWQVIKGESEVVWESLNDSSNLTSIQVPNGELAEGTQYTFKVRYKGASLGWSDWYSTSATTKVQFISISTPTLDVTGAPNDIPYKPTLTAGAFTVESDNEATDNHDHTNWQVIKVSDSSTVWESLNDSSNLTSITVPAGVLELTTQYKFRCQYVGEKYESSWSEVVGTTADEFEGIKLPQITITGTDSTNVTYESMFEASDLVFWGPGQATLDKVDWALYKGESKVWSDTNSVTFKLLSCFAGYKLEPQTDYVLKYRQHVATGNQWSDWCELSFTTASDLKAPSFKFKMKNKINLSKLLTWFNSETFKVYLNGEYNENLTYNYAQDVTLSAEGDLIEIKNEVDPTNYPRALFAMDTNDEAYYGNLISVEAPLPTMRETAGGTLISNLSGTGESGTNGTTSSVGTNGSDEFGIFTKCVNLNSLPTGLFRYNNQVKSAGGIGGNGGIADAYGTKRVNNGGSGGNGYGCFQECASIKEVPQDLFWYTPKITSFDGRGGSGGTATGGSGGSSSNPIAGATGSTGGNGGVGYGCFYKAGLISIPDQFFKYCQNVTSFGAVGGNGGSAEGGEFGPLLTTGGAAGSGGAGGVGGNGGSAYGCFYDCQALTSLPPDLFKYWPKLTIVGGQGGNGGDANGYRGGNGGSGGLNSTGEDGKRGANGGRGGSGGTATACFNSSVILNVPSNLFDNNPELITMGAKSGNGGSAKGGKGGGGGYTNNWEGAVGGDGGDGGAGGTGGNGGDGGEFLLGSTLLESIGINLLKNNKKITSLGGAQGIKGSNSSGGSGSVGSGTNGGSGGRGGAGGTGGAGGAKKGVFVNCSALTVVVHIGSPNVTSAANFAAGSAARGTVYVPTGSTTATTFKGDSSANVNVVEEETA